MSAPKLRFKEFKDPWSSFNLGEVCTFSKGKELSKSDLSENGEPCILYGELYTRYGALISTVVNKTNSKFKSLARANKNSVLIPSSGETAIDIACASALKIDDVLIGGDLNILTPNSNINGHFLSLQINGKQKNKLSNLAQGATVVHLYADSIKKLECNFPSLAEQNKISHLFETIEKKIRLQQEKIDLLIEQKKGYMQKIFSQELRFKDEDGQEFPDWNNVFINDVCEVGSCTRVHQKDWTSNGVPFFRARDIVAINNGEEAAPLFISEETFKEKSSKSGIVKKGDVMITGVGTIGVPYLIQHDNPIYFKDGNVIWLKNSNKINGEFLYYTILSKGVQNFIKTTSGLGTVGTYTIDNAKKTPLRLPCIKEQNKIVSFLDKIFVKTKVENQKFQQLTKQKKAISQQMFI